MLDSSDSISSTSYQGNELSSGFPPTFEILGTPIAAITMDQAINLVSSWIVGSRKPRLVTFTNVHMLTEGHSRRDFLSILRETDLNCADGMPLVWVGKHRLEKVSQVCGPDFFEEFFATTATSNIKHFFYGGADGVAGKVVSELRARYSSIQIAGTYTPPFRTLTDEEDEAIVQQINDSGADMVWVCLGCPKQERWMYQHRNRLRASVILAVGQAFDVFAGVKQRAPAEFRTSGLEWLYRAFKDPKRLIGRYLVSNTMFLLLMMAEFLKRRQVLVAHPRI
jgi:N-acetylglucosaminyldiphosphoundecaprenol N-acetyl-beta-D-mannosaminyltransferase